jgi:hypothetical protein
VGGGSKINGPAASAVSECGRRSSLAAVVVAPRRAAPRRFSHCVFCLIIGIYFERMTWIARELIGFNPSVP